MSVTTCRGRDIHLLLGITSVPRILAWTVGSLLPTYAVFELGFKLAMPTGTVIRALLGDTG